MNQEKKALILGKAKKEINALKKLGFKISFAVRHHSTLVANIKANGFDGMGDLLSKIGYYPDANFGYLKYKEVVRYYDLTAKENEVIKAIDDLINALNCENFDNSDLMTDYFHVGYYLSMFYKD